jgi:hypothetical protein
MAHRFDLRLILSHLADSDARQGAARWLLVLCTVGFVVTLVILRTLGYGLERWAFVLLVWGVLIFLPLRIFLESMQTLGLGMRRVVADRAAADPQRYEDPALLPVAVRTLARRAVRLPRICLPPHAQQAREAAVAILSQTRARRDGAGRLRLAIRTLLAAVAQESEAASTAATGVAAENIQARWEGARALGTLGVLVSILTEAYEDRWGAPPDVPELGGRPITDYLDAVLDYCDEAALQVDVLPWADPPLETMLSNAQIEEVRATWRSFLAAGLPAPRALAAFVAAVLPEQEV